MKARIIFTFILILVTLLSIVSADDSPSDKIIKLKTKLKSAKNTVKKEAKNVASKAKETTEKLKNKISDKLKKKIDQKMKNAKQKLEKLEGDNSPEAEKLRKEIIETTKKEIQTEIYREVQKSSNEIIKQDIFSQDFKNAIDNSELPEFLKHIDEELDPNSINWNFPKEAERNISIALNERKEKFNQELGEEIDTLLKEFSSKKPSDEEIEKAAKKLTEKVQKDIIENDKTKETLEKIEQNAEKFKDKVEDTVEKVEFKIQEFRNEVKETVNEIKDEYKNISSKEKQELDDFVLAANEKLNNLLAGVKSEKTKNRIVKNMRKDVSKLMESNNRNYDHIAQQIDTKVDQIQEAQLKHVKDTDLKLRIPYPLIPKQPFKFSLEDVMVHHKSDIEFYEFKSVEYKSDKKIIGKNGQEEGYISVTPETIEGIAFSKEGKYEFAASLKYTYMDDEKQPTIIDTILIMKVSSSGGSTKSNRVEKHLLVVCSVLAILSVTLILYQCHKRFGKRQGRYQNVDRTIDQADHTIESSTGFESA